MVRVAFCVGVAVALLGAASGASARGHSYGGGYRVHYGGGHHTGSHGGYYLGGNGSSHRGGHYRNALTGNRYGTHR